MQVEALRIAEMVCAVGSTCETRLRRKVVVYVVRFLQS